MSRSLLGLSLAAILVSSLGALTVACGSAEETEDITSAETIKSANVALTVHDTNGTRVGEGSGILISPTVVLTSAHLVAGNAQWKVRTADGKTATGTRGLTYDWMVYNSDLAHPRKHDVAVIYLDEPIKLAAYPKVASSRVAAGTNATRIRGTGAGFENISSTLSTLRTFPNAYVTDMKGGETLDTGGAVLDDHNHIIGVVSSRGLTTSKMYIARTDDLSGWLSPKTVCSTSVGVRTYGTPSSSSGGSSSGGSSSGGSSSGGSSSGGSSSGGSSSGGSSSGASSTSSSSGGSSSGSTSSSSGSTGNPCTPTNDGGGHCHGNCGSAGYDGVPTPGPSTTTSTSSSSGASSSTSSSGGTSGTDGIPSSTSSSSGGGGTSTSSSSSGTSGTPASSGTNGIPGSTSSSSGASGNGGNTSSSSGASSGTNGIPTPGLSSGAGGAQPSGTGNACEGVEDSPDCPGDPDGCTGSSCGGGNPDNSMDYGGCPRCSGAGPIVK